jgi:hypothetical protein
MWWTPICRSTLIRVASAAIRVRDSFSGRMDVSKVGTPQMLRRTAISNYVEGRPNQSRPVVWVGKEEWNLIGDSIARDLCVQLRHNKFPSALAATIYLCHNLRAGRRLIG